MGLYDTVIYKTKCFSCKRPMTEFQSHDDSCNLKILKAKQVRHFYNTCPSCLEWNEFVVRVLKYRVIRVLK